MTTPTPKRTRRTLTAIEAADKIARRLCVLPERIAEARAKAADDAEIALRASTYHACNQLILDTPESERVRIGKVLLATEANLHGFDLGGANDAEAASDDVPDAQPLPRGALPLDEKRLSVGRGHR
jgi:hypothetical protein